MPPRKVVFRINGIPQYWSRSTLEKRLHEKFPGTDLKVTSLYGSCYPTVESQTALLSFESGELPEGFLALHNGLRSDHSFEVDSALIVATGCLRLTTIYVPNDNEPPIVDIIFVHGLSGHAIGSWTARNSQCWPRDFLGPELRQARIMTFGYEAKLDKDTSTSRLSDYGGTLLGDMLNMRDSEETRERPLFLIGHSFGGTVITYALHLLRSNLHKPGYEDLFKAVRCAVFFGVPHHGMSITVLEPLTQKRSEPSKQRLLQDLLPGSEILNVLRETLTSLSSSIRFITCVEQKLTADPSSANAPDRPSGSLFVDEQQARIYSQNEDIVYIQLDHREMIKFSHNGDGHYREVLRLLLGAMKSLDQPTRKGLVHHLSATDILSPPEFVGRADELKALRQVLSQGRLEGHMKVVSIVGTHGVGKTQLALQYIEKYHKEYSMSFSADMTNAVTFGEQMEHIAYLLTGERERSMAINCSTVKTWLRKNLGTRVLIVFDNVDEITFEEFQHCIPRHGSGDIIITTKGTEAAQKLAGSLLNVVRLHEWSEENAMNFLRGRLGQETVREYAEAAHGVVEIACGLPLAMDQIARHTQFSQQTLAETLEDLNVNRIGVLKSVTTKRGIADCFETTFKRLGQHAPSALELASRLAYLEPRSLGSEIMTTDNILNIPSLRNIMKDPVAFKAAYTRLLDVGILRKNSVTGAFSFHDLAHSFLREWLPLERRRAIILETVTFLFHKLPPADDVHAHEVWKQASLYLPHAVRIIDHSQQCGILNKEVFEVSLRAAGTLVEKSLEDLAKSLVIRAYKQLDCDSLGLSVEKRVRALTTIGYVFNYNHDFESAAPYYEQALTLSRRNLGLWNEETLVSFHNIGGIYYSRGDYEKAIQCFSQVIETGRKLLPHLGDNGVHPYASIVSLAETYRAAHNPEKLFEAEQLGREAIAGFLHRQGKLSSWTLYAMGQLGKTLLEISLAGLRDATDEAEEWLEKAYDGLAEVMGPEDQYTKDVQGDLERLHNIPVPTGMSASQISLD